ncbi:MAG: FAD binding domain-containing protein [Candidatus Binatia bacterium]
MIESFVLHQPDSLPAALNLLAEHPQEARVLAGGSELILLLKMGLASAKHIVNIKRMPGLAHVDYEPNSKILRIGALVTHRALEKSEVVRKHFPVIIDMERQLANVRIRNVGTLAGNLSFAEPHADPGALLLAYDAKVKLRSLGGERTLKMGDFFVDYYQTALKRGELLTEIEIPKPAENCGGAYLRFCPGERPMVGVAAFSEWKNGACAAARLALGCVGPTPMPVTEVEEWLAGKARGEILARAEELGAIAAQVSQPLEDVWGSVEYKRQIVKTLVARGLSKLCQETRNHG